MADTQLEPTAPTAPAVGPTPAPSPAVIQPAPVPARAAGKTRGRGMPARPAIVTGLNAAGMAGAGLHASAGMPGLLAGAGVAAGGALIAAVTRPSRGRAAAARTGGKTAVAAGRARGSLGTAPARGAGKPRGAAKKSGATAPHGSGLSLGRAGRKTGGTGKSGIRPTPGKVSLTKGSKPTAPGAPSTTPKAGTAPAGSRGARKGLLGRKHGTGRTIRRGLFGKKTRTPKTAPGTSPTSTPGSATGTPGSPAVARRAAKTTARQARQARQHTTQTTPANHRLARIAHAARHPLSALGQAVKNTAHRAHAAHKKGAPARAAARKAWAKKLTIQAGRGSHRAVRNTLVAAVRGTATAIWRFSLTAGFAKAADVWGRRRAWQRAADRQAADLAAVEAAVKDADLMAVADAVREPKTTPPPTVPVTAPTGEPLMTDSLYEASAEMAGAASAYEPTNMTQVGNDFANLPEVFRNVTAAMQIRIDIARDKLPLDEAILEQMGAVAGLLEQAAMAAEEIGPAFRSIHEVDIQRIEAPRVNEDMWNPDRQRD